MQIFSLFVLHHLFSAPSIAADGLTFKLVKSTVHLSKMLRVPLVLMFESCFLQCVNEFLLIIVHFCPNQTLKVYCAGTAGYCLLTLLPAKVKAIPRFNLIHCI